MKIEIAPGIFQALSAEEYMKEMEKLSNKPTISLSPEFLSRIDMIECRLSKLEWAINNNAYDSSCRNDFASF